MNPKRQDIQPNLVENPHVNTTDYYSDLLLDSLILWLEANREKLKSIKRVLEIGTGRGYMPITLAKMFPDIETFIATDIDPHAVELATANSELNNLSHRIDVRAGNLFEPVKGEKPFDLILTAPPQLPLTPEQIREILQSNTYYHLTTSAGGKKGRDIVDAIIHTAPLYLAPHGMITIVHSDIIGFEESESLLTNEGMRTTLIGKRAKLVSETTLTRLAKPIIEQSGYVFRTTDDNQEYFTIGVVLGEKIT